MMPIDTSEESNQTSILSNSVPKNTNPEIYPSNEQMKPCVLCDEYKPPLVNHYKVAHPDHEVYVSRVSPSIANILRSSTIAQQPPVENLHHRIFFPCYFCNNIRNFPLNSWPEHFLGHTGEYMYTCKKCQMQFMSKTGHLLSECECTDDDIKKRFEWNLDIRDFAVHMCKLCNYIQVSATMLKVHIEREHDIRVNVNRQIDKVVLMPANNGSYKRVDTVEVDENQWSLIKGVKLEHVEVNEPTEADRLSAQDDDLSNATIILEPFLISIKQEPGLDPLADDCKILKSIVTEPSP